MLDGSHPRFNDEMALIASINAHVKALKHMPHREMLPLAKRMVQLLEALQELRVETLQELTDTTLQAIK